MKKILVLAVASMIAVACSPVKISELQEIGVNNQTCVLYFSKPIKQPIRVSIDDREIPIALPATGRQLEVHHLAVGQHRLRVESDFYIFSEPIRSFEYSPEANQVVLVFAVRSYLDETAPVHHEQPGFFKRAWNSMLFWRKKTVEDVSIDTSGVYGEFTD